MLVLTILTPICTKVTPVRPQLPSHQPRGDSLSVIVLATNEGREATRNFTGRANCMGRWHCKWWTGEMKTSTGRVRRITHRKSATIPGYSRYSKACFKVANRGLFLIPTRLSVDFVVQRRVIIVDYIDIKLSCTARA